MMVVTGAVRVDLRGLEPEDRRRAAAELTYAPGGAQAELIVGRLQPDPNVVDVLRTFAGQLGEIRVLADSGHVTALWVRALRTGMQAVS